MKAQILKDRIVNDILEISWTIKDKERVKNFIDNQLQYLIFQVKLDMMTDKPVEIDSNGANDIIIK